MCAVQKCCHVSCIKDSGYNKNKAKKSRNHTELLFRKLGVPIKIIKKANYVLLKLKENITLKGLNIMCPEI